MPSRRAALLQGTLDLLILEALSTGELHGLGVSRRVEQMTGGTFVVQPGSLFPALHRLEEAGWLAATWDASANNRRAKYHADESRPAAAHGRSRELEPDCARDGAGAGGVTASRA